MQQYIELIAIRIMASREHKSSEIRFTCFMVVYVGRQAMSCFSLIVSVVSERTVTVAPVLINLDEGLEVDALAEEFLQTLAGFS